MNVEKRKGRSTLLTINGITKTTTEWAAETGIDTITISRRIRDGWPEDKLFQQTKPTPHYSFNEHYFDIINDEHKAYWIGFIWCDGYMAIRNRNNRTSYEFKLTLKEDDCGHLEKFNKDIDGNYKVNFYNYCGFGKELCTEARLLITNQHFGKTLVDQYGLIPYRSDCSKIIQSIPNSLMKHFIRGVIDADGAFSKYQIIDKGYNVNKYMVSIGTNEDILRVIERHLMDNGLINILERKLQQRHIGGDGEYRILEISGKAQCLNVLNYIYKDAKIYLDRKYKKYLNIVGGKEVLSSAV